MKKIFLVDDDSDIRRLAELAFDALSTDELSTFESGEQLRIGLQEAMPDLFLLDVVMPEESGLELLARLREDLGDAIPPVAFLTAKTEPDEIEALEQLSVAAVLAKPFAPKQLVTAVEALFKDN